MNARVRLFVASALAVAAITLGAVALLIPQVDPGLRLARDNARLVVRAVEPGTAAQLLGIEPGAVVRVVDGTDVASLSSEEVDAYTSGATFPASIALDSTVPLRASYPVPAEPSGAGIVTPGDGPMVYGIWLAGFDEVRRSTLQGYLVGLAGLAAGWWWLATGRAGGTLRRLVVSLPVAVATPWLVLPFSQVLLLPAIAMTAVLVPLAMVPLAIDFATLVDGRRMRRLCFASAVAAAAAALATGLILPPSPELAIARAILSGAVAFVPAVVASRPALFHAAAPGSGGTLRLVESGELLLAGITPAVSAVSMADVNTLFVWPLVLWLATLLLLRALTLRPLARLAGRATLQRDVVVAATEAERARIAADIHDEALQDLTLLVRRLDAAGNAEDAEAARQIAARLRAICGELRLPILDDLGVGPALEWLTERVEPLASGPVYLERSRDESRLPSPVELAAFRIAQEALTNAVRHGRPPIVVRYRSGASWLELDVDDAGDGVPAGAAERAEQAGHFGLLNMSQRAEQIGASLAVGRRPGGGTRVSLTWEAEGSVAPRAQPAEESGSTASPARTPEQA